MFYPEIASVKGLCLEVKDFFVAVYGGGCDNEISNDQSCDRSGFSRVSNTSARGVRLHNWGAKAWAICVAK
jgi:hypothetical protein